MMDKITVIVPVYNAEKFITKCVKSVLTQTYENIELILVNDGSKDNSLGVLKHLESCYPDIIKVFSQENKGKEAARNFGIDNAAGKYLTFLDSDDWIDEDYIEVLYAAAQNSDIVVSGYKRYSNDYIFQYASVPTENEWAKFKYCSTAGKMYSAEFVNKNHLRYKKFNFGEDAYFSVYAYSLTNRVSVVPYAGYCNYENILSVTNIQKYDEKNLMSIVIKDLDNAISGTNPGNIDKKLLSYFYIKTLVLDTFLHKDYVDCKYLTNEFKENVSWYKSVLTKMNLKFKLRFQKGENGKVNFIVNVFIAAYKLHCVAILMWLLKKVKLKLM